MGLLSHWYEFGQAVEDSIAKCYEKVARSVVKRPMIWIICMSCTAAICCVGLVNTKVSIKKLIRSIVAFLYYSIIFQVIISSDKMWVPEDSEALDIKDFIAANFGQKPRGGPVLFTATDNIDRNIINLDAFETLWDVHEAIIAKAEGDNHTTYHDLCANRDAKGRCMVYGVLQFFNGNRTYYNTVVHNKMNLIQRISASVFPDGTGVLRDQLFGNCTIDPTTMAILACEGIMQFYRILPTPLDTAIAWERSMVKVVDGFDTKNVSVFRNANSAYDDELAKSSEADMPLIFIMYAIVILLTFFVLAKDASCVGSRIGLSIVGLLLIALAIVAGFGICSGLGVASTTIHFILPFIIVGMGVNDLYIITSSFDAQDPSLSIEDRMAGAMRRCGKSIGFTAVTSAAGFYLGGLSEFLALRHFCYYAGTCVLCNWVLQVTFFCAALGLDAQRRDWNKLDLLCCITSCRAQQTVQPFQAIKEADESAESAVPSSASAAEVDPAIAKYVAKEVVHGDAPANDAEKKASTVSRSTHRDPRDLNYVEYFFSELYFPFLSHWAVRLFLVAGFCGLLIANIYGTFKVAQGFEATDFLAKDSYLQGFVASARPLKLFAAEQSGPVEIVFQDIYYHNQSVQEDIFRIQAQFLNNTAYNKGPMVSWLTAFYKFVKTPAPLPLPFPQNPFIPHLNEDGYLTDEFWFYKALHRFLVVAPRFNADIHFVNNTEGSLVPDRIRISRVMAFHNHVTGPIESINTMKHAQDLMDTASFEPKPLVFSPSYVKSESYEISVEQTISLLVLALIAVAVITFLVVKPHHLGPALVAVVLVAATYVNFIGNMPRWGMLMQINYVTIVFIVMSTGLIVDYILHVLHHYQAQPYTVPPLDRLKEALVQIGPPILMGCLTMLIAIIPTAFGESYGFKMFFRTFFCVIIYSLGHALVLLPCLLPTMSFLMCETCITGAHSGDNEGGKAVEMRTKPAPAAPVMAAQPADEVVPFAVEA